MNLKKAELRFKREWANAAVKLKRTLPEVEVVAPAIGADIVVSFTGFPEADALDYTGCKCNSIVHNSAVLIVPPEWVSAPTRLFFTLTSKDTLHNALLDAGIADWLDLRYTSDKAALEVEFLEHPTSEQITALKVGYDVVTFDELVYTFVKRGSGAEPQAEAAPLVDPAKVEARLRAAWGVARAGKILKVEATDNPRRWLVTTVKSIPANANFLDHGLEQIELWAAERRALVEITPVLWSKLLDAAKPAPAVEEAPVPTQPTEPEFSGDLLLLLGEGCTVLSDERSSIGVHVNDPDCQHYDALVEAGMASKFEVADWFDYQITDAGLALAWAMLAAGVTRSDSAAPLPELDEPDLELNALKAQVDSLQDIIRALTPVASEWQTLRLTIKRDGTAITAHPEIAVEEAKGWRVHSVQFAANGEDRLFVLMERKPQATPAPRHASAYATAGWPTANGREHRVIVGGSNRLEEIMIRDMNAEIADSARALRGAFQTLREMGN